MPITTMSVIVDKVVSRAETLGFWKLMLFTVAASELFTLIMNTLNSYIWWGEFVPDLIWIGVVDALVVSFLVGLVLVLLLERLRSADKKTEEKSAHLDNILRTSTDMAIAATDLNFRVTLFNPAAEEMFGYKAPEVLGRDLRQMHMAEGVEPDRFAAAMEAFDRDGELSFSLSMPKADNDSMRYLDVRVTGIVERDGTRIGYVMMARDITERRNAETAIRESEERFRSLVESTSDWVWEVDERTRYTYASPRVRDILGYKPEEIIGMTPFGLMLPSEADRVKAAFELFAANGRPFAELENTNVHKDGRLVVLETSGVPIYDREGVFRGYRGIDRDITERKSAETALRESEEKFRTLLEQTLFGVAIIQDGRYAYVNPRHAEMLGYTQEEMTSLGSVYDRVHPDDIEMVRENIRKRTTGEVRDIRYRFRFIKKDGETLHVEVHGSTTEYGGRPAVLSSVLDISERVKFEEEIKALNEELERRVEERTAELRHSEARYRMLMEQASDGIGIMAPDGSISAVNSRFCEMLGYGEEEVLALTIEDIFEPQDMPFIMSDIIMIRSGDTVVRDRTVRKKDGSTLETEISAKMLGDGSVMAIGRDITARKEAERALRKSEERLRHVVENMPVMMNAFDEEWNIVMWNRECERVTGYSSEEVVGNPDILEVFYPDEEYRLAMFRDWHRRGNNYRDWEWDITCKDGSVRTVAWSNRSDIISIPGWASWGIGIDVTERNRAQDELRESERRFRSILENANLIAVMLDMNGSIMFCNDYLLSLTGRLGEDLEGRNWFDTFIPEPDREEIRSVLDTIVAKGDVVPHYMNPILTSDGELRQVSWNNTVMRDNRGRITGVTSIGEDITERLKAQEERETVLERLGESQKMEAVGNLAGGIAHDFNNLLTVIKGDNEQARSIVGDGSPAYEFLGHIDTAAGKASELIKKLLIFSRRKPMARLPMDLNAAVEDVVGIIRRLIGGKIAVEFEPGPDAWKILADKSGIEQVVMNLALNARDAMQDGGSMKLSTGNVELDEDSCRTIENARPGRYVRLTVSDTGSGMDEGTMRHIFEPFFSTKGRGRGTGLGLSVVYGIASEHGGWINVESRPGEGSRFDVYFEALDGY